MADWSQNISNTVRVFGVEIATRWGQTEFPYTMVWGTSLWGYGFTIPLDVKKQIDNSLVPTWDKSQFLVEKVLQTQSVSPTFDTSLESLKQGIWDFVFVSDTTNAEDRDFASFTCQVAGSTSFTCQAAGSTTWS